MLNFGVRASVVVILSFLAKYGAANCPGPNGEVKNGYRWVEGHFMLRCFSGHRKYKISPIACATPSGTPIPWNRHLNDGSIRYECVNEDGEKYLKVHLSVGIQDTIHTAPEDKSGPIPGKSSSSLLARICFIPGVGRVSMGDEVQRGKVVLRCEKNGIYKVTQCVLPTGDFLEVGSSVEAQGHRWSCKSVRGGAGAVISSFPVSSSASSTPSCSLGAVKEDKGFRLRCTMNEAGRPSWSVTHCKLRRGNRLVPVGGSLKMRGVVFRCILLDNKKVRLSVRIQKGGKRRGPGFKNPSKRRGAASGLRCSDPCKHDGKKICPGEDAFVAKNEAGDSRVRCTRQKKLNEYCRVRALGSDDFYELDFGTFTEVEGRILACAKLGTGGKVMPGNTAPASQVWRTRLQRHRYQFIPVDMLK